MKTGTGFPSIGFVSTYPPTVCGLASYTASLMDAVAGDRGSRSGLGVVGFHDATVPFLEPPSVLRHRIGDVASLRRVTSRLNSYDTVSIQHEFGIFGGSDGEEVIDLVRGLTAPTAVTFHTVLDKPSPRQRVIVDALVAHANRVVVLSTTAARRLAHRYGVDPRRIETIPHGADARFAGPSLATGDRALALTWGLIGPGKGLEAAIEAFATLTDIDPMPRYLIAGATHPNVRHTDGETYRQGLVALARRLGLSGLVEFDDRYLDREGLARLVRSADVVVLPYQSREQVTSGVLVEAIAASKPVIATRFPHAVELLEGGAGITVAHGDTAGMSAALRLLLTDRSVRTGMEANARRLADGWFWPAIGRRYGRLMTEMADEAATRDRDPLLVHHASG